jgi:hypothetical protein
MTGNVIRVEAGESPASGGKIVHLASVGEDGCTLYASPRDSDLNYGVDIHFDASPEAGQRLLEVLRRALGS